MSRDKTAWVSACEKCFAEKNVRKVVVRIGKPNGGPCGESRC